MRIESHVRSMKAQMQPSDEVVSALLNKIAVLEASSPATNRTKTAEVLPFPGPTSTAPSPSATPNLSAQSEGAEAVAPSPSATTAERGTGAQTEVRKTPARKKSIWYYGTAIAASLLILVSTFALLSGGNENGFSGLFEQITGVKPPVTQQDPPGGTTDPSDPTGTGQGDATETPTGQPGTEGPGNPGTAIQDPNTQDPGNQGQDAPQGSGNPQEPPTADAPQGSDDQTQGADPGKVDKNGGSHGQNGSDSQGSSQGNNGQGSSGSQSGNQSGNGQGSNGSQNGNQSNNGQDSNGQTGQGDGTSANPQGSGTPDAAPGHTDSSDDKVTPGATATAEISWTNEFMRTDEISYISVAGINYEVSTTAEPEAVSNTAIRTVNLDLPETSKTYAAQVKATAYKLKNVSPVAMMALDVEGFEEPLIYTNADYSPETLGDLVRDLGLRGSITFSTSVRGQTSRNGYTSNRAYRTDVSDAAWTHLFTREDATRADYGDFRSGNVKLLFTSGGEQNPTNAQMQFGVSDNGYLYVSVLKKQFTFDIGEKAARAFIETVTG